VVGHQAIAPDRRLRPRRRLAQKIEIQRIIAILEEYPLAPVAPLGDMCGMPGSTMRASLAIASGYGNSRQSEGVIAPVTETLAPKPAMSPQGIR
jgi:hypothetical protein